MIALTENKMTDEFRNKYMSKGYRVASVFDRPYIKPKESVGIELHTLYKTTIDLIERLLYFKHTVTLKFLDKVYTLNSLDEWKTTIQNPKDQIKTLTIVHPILQEYYNQRKEYFQRVSDNKRKEQYKVHVEGIDLPDKDELDNFLSTFAPRYDIPVDYTDIIDKARAYQQIKFYLDNNLEYTNPAPIIDVEYTPFANMVSINHNSLVEEPDIEYFGNEIYFEDTAYKLAG